MNTTISEDTKVILLLTSFFNSSELRQCKPLTVNGYGYFARWLNWYGYRPADLLLQEKLITVLNEWEQSELHSQVKQNVSLGRLDRTIADITPDRIQSLLGRGASLSMALDKWTSAGIWILDRGNPDYPAKIRKALKEQAPAILFGVGNKKLLSKPAIGFVGSRDCEVQDQTATTHYVNAINQKGYQVVSGAAKGVDSHAMLASLENGYASIGIVADSLFKASVNKQWRDYLKSDHLALITPFYPESKFSPADAMQRNKFIYLLSDATIVVRSGETGGTWKGAEENLKKGWVPLMVSEHKTPNYAANQKLLDGQIKKAKLAAQKITPLVTADDFIGLLNIGGSQIELQQREVPAQQGSLLDGKVSGDLFAAPPEQENIQEYTQKTIHSINGGYADKDEIDVTALTSLDSKVTETIEPQRDEEPIVVDAPVNGHCLQGNQSLMSELPPENTSENDAENRSEHKKLSPVLHVFYEQIVLLIEAQENKKVSYDQLEKAFPEFSIMSKTALTKWIKHLIEYKYLQQPGRKKSYCLMQQAC